MRLYTAIFSKVTVSAVQDLFEITSPSDAVTRIRRLKLSQSSDVGDAAAEILNLLAKRGATSSGSGGSTVTPVPKQTGDPAYGGTVEANNTTQASGGTIVNVGSEGMNIQIGTDMVWTPEAVIVLSPGERFVVSLVDAPADAITLSGEIEFEELGG